MTVPVESDSEEREIAAGKDCSKNVVLGVTCASKILVNWRN